MDRLNIYDFNILDLPDETLFIISMKLNTIDVFRSLVYVNQRLNQLALDPIYVRDLDMTILSKICLKIIPHIHDQVHKLSVEQYSIKQILRACIYLLDGRFDSLSTLIIKVGDIFDPFIDTSVREKLPKLKYFSLITSCYTTAYDDLSVPLPCRMINLEVLKLYLLVDMLDATYIDDIQLDDQFLIYMTLKEIYILYQHKSLRFHGQK
ncbi:hypothetical protein I4U23_000296 [Adineta vaga]|nr:hypothetical protein I4U23_000296 [Adineta vaga]